MASVPLNLAHHPTHVVLDLGCTRSIGSRAAIRRFQKHALHYGMTTEFYSCNSPLCLPTLRQKLVGKVVLFIFRHHLHVLPELTCLRRATCQSYSPFLTKKKSLGMTIQLDPKGDTITCPSFGMDSSPAEYFTMGHIVLDLTSLAYQPKSRERSALARRNM